MAPSAYPVILTYHSISDGASPLKIAPGLFREQMQWLGANVQVVSLAELVDCLLRRARFPESAVVLTFDDAYLDFYTQAAPVLRRFSLPATVFVPTAYCGRTNRWPGQPDWVAEEAIMNWQQISELSSQGFAFDAHGVSHRFLTNLAAAEIETELTASKQEIEAHTKKSVRFFCYPFGAWNEQVLAMVRAHYAAACTTGASVIHPNSHPHALPRVDVHYLRNPRWFRRLFTAPWMAYLTGRRWVRRLRGQPEGIYARM
jgi:peptidoglycan/xylan/chitin deacetylase (PgdA/CDA1 family)